MNALIGIRIRQGKLALNESIAAPEWKEDRDKYRQHFDITVDMALRMSTGLQFHEKYDAFGDATHMFEIRFGICELFSIVF